ncbi:cytochrome c oxidase assembly protein [Maritimibacter sp. 55A14]|uniref:cytochrome c oxidase assembly protein n=1 Tax=Maritimibacter sp. 55A14 TaxID=2174844 RepID=UPI000D61B18E|nr:cytochrome c oxidase assembly protein [Maritimibacter sp. 55A14]PWE33327.1 cytochrome c oxidase assembly protein [Maritimibacter sp. 55A14]
MTGQRKTVYSLLAVLAVMGSLSAAAVPLYNWFCRVTGYGGETNTAVAAPEKALDQTITVRFDASLESGMPWQFRPMQKEMTLKIGEEGLAFYEAYNPTDRRVAGTASYNVAPFSAGYYFSKIECFCFTEQVLEPGERVQMPVSFYVDPGIVDDREAKYAHTITLSYTFHETDLPQSQAGLQQDEKQSEKTVPTEG